MKDKQPIIIAIDGYSSTGKSTLAKQIAKALNYIYIDTGAMYRAVTYYALQHDYIGENTFCKKTLLKHLDDIDINFIYNPDVGFAEVYLNGVNIEKQIRQMKVSSFVSEIATVPEIREKLVAQQRKIGQNKGIVMDGRDIGSVVFPNAELKIFMTASPQVRAQRRYDEMIQKGEKVDFQSVLDNVIKRDRIDSSRKASPLVKTIDAVEIDNSNLSINEQFDKVLQLAKERIAKNNPS